METLELHPLLKLIKVEEYPKERIEQLWEKVRTQEYAFDDVLKDDPNIFLSQLLLPNNLAFEVGDLEGLALASGVIPGVGCQLHFLIWAKQSLTQMRAAAKSLLENLFISYGLNRVSAFIPEGNLPAIRLSVTLGFVFEGELREAFLHNGTFQSIHVYGLLKSDFTRVKGF